MKITKFGHCCLLIEEGNLRLLTDPGMFSSAQNEVTGINIVLITHEHGDHYHVDSVKAIMKNNPTAKIITNTAVGKLLEKEGFSYSVLEEGQETTEFGVKIAGYGSKHAEIYKTISPVQNTGYFISDRLFYPGDAFTDPKRPVDILALPVAGPWMKISEALDYALTLKPKKMFPVHDGILTSTMFVNRVMDSVIKPSGIEMIMMKAGDTKEF